MRDNYLYMETTSLSKLTIEMIDSYISGIEHKFDYE